MPLFVAKIFRRKNGSFILVFLSMKFVFPRDKLISLERANHLPPLGLRIRTYLKIYITVADETFNFCSYIVLCYVTFTISHGFWSFFFFFYQIQWFISTYALQPLCILTKIMLFIFWFWRFFYFFGFEDFICNCEHCLSAVMQEFFWREILTV